MDRTFANRGTVLVPAPLGLTARFAEVPGKEAQWKGFVRKARLTGVPGDLPAVIAAIGAFLLPLAAAVAAGEQFRRRWHAPGPWA